MKFAQKFINKRFAKAAALLMKFVCYFVICFYVLCMALSFMGRHSFFLYTKSGTFGHAIYAEKNHAPHSRSMTVYMGDDIRVRANDKGQVDWTIQMGLSLMYAVHVIPMILAFWFLSRVFSNVEKEKIFTEQNSSYLFYYGLLQFFAAVFVPFIKLLICWIINVVSDSQISISTGHSMFNMLIPSIVFMVAAYIIHYGVHLQDETDHTLG